MKKLQKSKVVFQNGKEKSTDPVGKPKRIVDSVADNLVIDSKHAVEEIKQTKGVKSIEVWEEVKKQTTKKETSKTEK